MQDGPSTLPIAIAIVFVGGLIALSLYWALKPESQVIYGRGSEEVTVEPVTAKDHILGNPDAPVKIIEYSDLDCPYCRTFHATMKQIMATYGADGRVAWVYRHFPIVELHPNAPRLAEAAECVAESAGNDAFWKFIDGVFTAPNLNDRFDMTDLDAIAAVAGAPSSSFNECLNSGTFKEKVADQFAEATKAGGRGTPHNLIIGPQGEVVPMSGSRAYATVKEVIDALLADAGR
jgi:protein-disulfide isomerase